MDEFDPMVLQDAHQVFDIKSAKSKQFYKLLLSKKAKLPNMSKRLIADFDVEDTLDKIYFLASQCCEWNLCAVLSVSIVELYIVYEC